MPLDDLAPDEALALRFDEPAAAEDLAAWCGGHVERFRDADGQGDHRVVVWVPTDRGHRPAGLGSWIVRRGADRFEAVSATDFAARFQPADADASG
jgi:hypothetical protein